ncbi:amidase family protein [Psychromonas sp. L1A2]|uniref:amidase family protein n=1 Tax=Psychromonas sp. L1A2 TaxID=2686356 RepID=UPI00135C0FD2|nr:amidase family protein [Psychromonas sp. L1A2]
MKNLSKFPWEERDLAQQLTKSKKLIEHQASNVFTELFDVTEYANGRKSSHHLINEQYLNNAIVSVKDLFDVKGYKTKAGSTFLNDVDIASEDADAVKSLRKAGAVFLGHTNMTELAYSGLGVNPHYGTPITPLYKDEDRIAGGSTSGGAVSVALKIVDIALGSDTGGSLRIPSAFCGVTGFKPSQNSVSRKGSLPLSSSLDSIGPIANTVSECEIAWGVMSNAVVNNPVAEQAYFVIPSNFGMDLLDEKVKKAFLEVVNILKQTPGVRVEERSLPFLDSYKLLPVWQFSAFEAMNYYTENYSIDLDELDPRVASRLKRANSIDEKQFLATCQQRKLLIERYKTEEKGAVLLLPTVAILPPKLAELSADEDYDRINLLCLRNTTLANVLDGCSISLPYQYQGDHIGVMLTASNGDDNNLLSLSKRLESIILKSYSDTK